MARLVLLLTLLTLTMGVAACGGDDEGGGGGTLSYVPSDSPFVVSIGTDPEGGQIQAAQAIVDRFPIADQARGALEQALSEEDLDFEQDVRPILGNDFIVAATDVRSFTGGESNSFVGALQAADEQALQDLIEKSGAEEVGEASGATLYEGEDGDVTAVDGDTLVVAGGRGLLEEALERSEGDESLSEDDFDSALEELPEEALARGYFDLAGLLEADPDAADALKVPYVAAAETFGFAITAEEDALALDFRLATGGEELSDEDLPIASGEESPQVLEGEDKIGAGLRDPLRILTFAENAGQAADPSAFGDYNAGKTTIEQRIDVDIEEDILGQTDEVAMRFGLDGTFALTASLDNPNAFRQTLNRLGRTLPDILESSLGGTVGYSAGGRDNSFYALSLPDGGSVVSGIFDGNFVLSNDSGEAGTLSVSAESSAVEGAEGAVALRADAEQVANAALRQFGGELGIPGGGAGASLFTGPLGELTGWLSAEPEATSGRLTLGFDE